MTKRSSSPDPALEVLQRLFRWVMAFAGLSAAWFRQDQAEQQAQQDLQVACLAQHALSLRPH